jgi:hypothetical protein
LWSSEKDSQEFYINTDDLEAARQGVSNYEKHALVRTRPIRRSTRPARRETFLGYKVHILSKGQVISDV